MVQQPGTMYLGMQYAQVESWVAVMSFSKIHSHKVDLRHNYLFLANEGSIFPRQQSLHGTLNHLMSAVVLRYCPSIDAHDFKTTSNLIAAGGFIYSATQPKLAP